MRKLGVCLAGLVVMAVIAGPADSAVKFYYVTCPAGTNMVKSGNTAFTCRKRSGNTYQYRQGTCLPGLHLLRKKHEGHNYACGATAIGFTAWTKYSCPRYFSRYKAAGALAKTCRRSVPNFIDLKPDFR